MRIETPPRAAVYRKREKWGVWAFVVSGAGVYSESGMQADFTENVDPKDLGNAVFGALARFARLTDFYVPPEIREKNKKSREAFGFKNPTDRCKKCRYYVIRAREDGSFDVEAWRRQLKPSCHFGGEMSSIVVAAGDVDGIGKALLELDASPDADKI